jgi:hypothetical protein
MLDRGGQEATAAATLLRSVANELARIVCSVLARGQASDAGPSRAGRLVCDSYLPGPATSQRAAFPLHLDDLLM